ncbi:uncharacterized protein SPSK_02504 [Sporothrix schenckii 1099-18]|nr:uncharacterized protein SPSK_02504 [Sporothrix schenckii 1099-18]KJR86545.1 hypothetical protein SPSK_02504 [Sporothrix schenckii 1099-18]
MASHQGAKPTSDRDMEANTLNDPSPTRLSGADASGADTSGADSIGEKPATIPGAAPAAPPGPPPPPNGGTRAWLQVLGAFFINFNTWGIVNSYGVFQSYYSANLLATSTESAISWIGSIQAFLMLVIAVLCGRALDAGYFYTDILIGSFLEVFGTMMTSICKEYWQVFLAQGIVVGIGAGMVFIPGVAIVGTYFSTRRATAIGIAATGSCIGGIIYPIALRRLIINIGFGWAVRVMGFLMLATLIIAIAVMKPRLPPRKSGPLINYEALRDPTFAMWLVAIVFSFIGLYVPFFYVEQYATHIGIDASTASYMLIIINAASIPGRIVPSMLADKFGNMSILMPAVFFSGVITVAWIAVHDEAGIVLVSVFLGLTNGSIQAVVPATVPFLCPDLTKLGTNLGMTLFSAGLGMLIGSPVAGAIVDHQSRNGTSTVYWGAFLFAGVTTLAGAFLIVVVRHMKVGFRLVKA